MNYLSSFLDNKYTRWYRQIVERAANRLQPTIIEKHHILPKSLGGMNVKENLAYLTPREHFLCHLLLTRMTSGSANYKMRCAVNMFQNKLKITSRFYDLLRQKFIASAKGRPKPEGFGLKVAASNRRRKVSENVINKLREYNAQRIPMPEEKREKFIAMASAPKSEEHKQKISQARKGQPGSRKPKSEEHKRKISEARSRNKNRSCQNP